MKKSDAIDYFGSILGIVNALNAAGHPIRAQSVREWRQTIPELRALQLHRLTNGALKYDPAAY